MGPITESRFGTPPPRVEVPDSGLTADEVRERVEQGLTNGDGDRTSRTYGEIIRANVFTRFNAILGTMFVIVVAVGHFADALFGLILVINSLIGIVQEIRAKRTLDQLAVLAAPRARVVRDGDVQEIAVEAVVLDDLMDLRTGDQVPADGIVRSGGRPRDRRVAPDRGVRRRRQGARARRCCPAASWLRDRAVSKPHAWGPRRTRVSSQPKHDASR